MSYNIQRVLIVDDDPIQCITLKIQLQTFGIDNVRVAQSSKQGLAICEQQEIDLVFCDLSMPGEDGLTFLNALKKQNFQGKLCLLSGHDKSIIALAEMMCRQLGFGMVSSQMKPISNTDLASVLHSAIEAVPSPKVSDKVIEFLRSDLDSAFDSHRLVNFYQPQCRFANDTQSGNEVLIRWDHPQYGYISPMAFLPIIDKEQWHVRLFFYVLEQALEDHRSGKLSGSISVNAALANFGDSNFAFQVLECCERYDFSPQNLIIEMTEMEVYKHNPTMFENFARLRLNDVELAIDDFGAGYSSLIKLADLPFTEMKIDRALITSCHRDKRKNAILSLVVSMAKQLDMRLVAEGVEDNETWAHLQSMGIDLCQGYFTGRPQPIEYKLMA
ncbi:MULTISPECIES: EAL domain-containing response regulator [Vibrio]|uniref:EAL domain-containing response regulator n=1 Tax=Vibrio TaxID=662 RepID=UPI001F317451|nr:MULTISPECIES: EAL domain-containing response regulator [Vibrio]MCF7363705.1 EAL domain-containing response regulator [Vibrio sp. A1-b2]MCZ4372357.1 EAL domain-containing response regulator [Vibrio diazotrophicus]